MLRSMSPLGEGRTLGLRFYHRFRIAPGFTLNLRKRGASVSAGVRGAHVTIGTHGTRETVGLPGTGLFFSAIQGRRRSGAARRPAKPEPLAAPYVSSAALAGWGWAAKAIAFLALAVVIGLVIGLSTG